MGADSNRRYMEPAHHSTPELPTLFVLRVIGWMELKIFSFLGVFSYQSQPCVSKFPVVIDFISLWVFFLAGIKELTNSGLSQEIQR